MRVIIKDKDTEAAYKFADQWANTAQVMAEQLEDEGTILSVEASKKWYRIMDAFRQAADEVGKV